MVCAAGAAFLPPDAWIAKTAASKTTPPMIAGTVPPGRSRYAAAAAPKAMNGIISAGWSAAKNFGSGMFRNSRIASFAAAMCCVISASITGWLLRSVPSGFPEVASSFPNAPYPAKDCAARRRSPVKYPRCSSSRAANSAKSESACWSAAAMRFSAASFSICSRPTIAPRAALARAGSDFVSAEYERSIHARRCS